MELTKHIPHLENITDKDVIYFEEISSQLTSGIQTDAYVVVLCTAGKAFCKMEGKEYEIGRNDLIISHPNVFVSNAMVTLDFRCQGVVMSPSYFERILLVGGNCWDIGVTVSKNPVLHLSEEDAENAMFNFNILKRKMQHQHQPHYAETLKLLLQMMIYDFYDSLMPYLQMPDLEYGYSSAESIFNRFVQMLQMDNPVKRDVRHYAERLCITPKYLSSICKKQVGKTASEIITCMMVGYIKNMLESTDNSIKEIATLAGFDNLSFFGKYVKRELGVSPRTLRANRK